MRPIGEKNGHEQRRGAGGLVRAGSYKEESSRVRTPGTSASSARRSSQPMVTQVEDEQAVGSEEDVMKIIMSGPYAQVKHTELRESAQA